MKKLRRSDVTTILNAAYQYSIDNNGVLPAGITASSSEICLAGAASCTGFIDLSVLSLNGKYLVAIPTEPQKVNAGGAGYMINRDANGRITVNAQYAEQGAVISVTR